MGETVDGRLQDLMEATSCPREFGCVESDDICRARDIGYPDFVECLDSYRSQCSMKSDCGYGADNDQLCLCRCRVRVYLAKKETEAVT